MLKGDSIAPCWHPFDWNGAHKSAEWYSTQNGSTWSDFAIPILVLSAAFNTIDHEILLHLLQQDFGICGDALIWFKSYLAGRNQVIVQQQASKTFSLNCGVLFLLYASGCLTLSRSTWHRRTVTQTIVNCTFPSAQIHLTLRNMQSRLLRSVLKMSKHGWFVTSWCLMILRHSSSLLVHVSA